MKAWRENNLCYNYDEKWGHGYKCKGRLFMLSIDGSTFYEYTDLGNVEEEQFPNSTNLILLSEEMKVSFHTLKGT